ncbi:LacI family DNA-binding transcriptional regulator [Streptomyces sp. NPDC058221]|uniref:LacI family DNA-binding transcriptional regulator n=1 Tax=Streptomyces sp. NPDC058221 TaxID=3346388 RepID=UPI0036EA3727
MSSSLKEVAARAGVSARTVSNVVNGSARVSPHTRRRVQEAIDELGYRPNLAARSLRAGRTGIIGLAVPELHSPYFGELAGLLVDEARRRSWTVIIEQTQGNAEFERRLLTGDSGRVMDGLIISPWALAAEELTATAHTLPIVLLGECSSRGKADHVAVDSVAAADEATTHLLGLGRRRVAAIGLQPHLRNGTAQQRTEGYRRALQRAGIAPRPEWERAVASLHRADGARAMTELLGGETVPDAVFAFSDELALGAMHVAHLRGVRMPEQLAVVGFDDVEDGRFSHPPLTTVSPDKRQIAQRALQCLADRIYSPLNQVPAATLTIAHRLLVRGSTVAQAQACE